MLFQALPANKGMFKVINKNIRYPANVYLLKVNDRNKRKRCETCSNLTIKTPERH